MAAEVLVAIGVGLLAAAGLGVWLGRVTGQARQRIRELEAELLSTQEALSGYKTQVADHFEKTGELLNELTHQFHGVYEHLADGARALCPERAVALAAGAGPTLLGGGTRDLESMKAVYEETAASEPPATFVGELEVDASFSARELTEPPAEPEAAAEPQGSGETPRS
jgi:hypothetical protein